ncbi:baseplate J/gp47 family protein [Neisseriaceae bacterium TC5R-5]|nr:baseplate J/gp47 family protein [Neisseriaceae bacterium TC5R-5]
MPLSTPNFDSIRSALLRDLQNLRADAHIKEDSDFFVRASSVASAVEGLYQHQSWVARQIFPDSADRDYLEQHAQVRGLMRKGATRAAGLLKLTGNPNATFKSGLIVSANELEYSIPLAGMLNSQGELVVEVLATQAGSRSNLLADTIGELMAAPMGIASKATFQEMKGGTDEESDSELLARLLDVIRRPPAGGNKYDYRRWALEVEGVVAAYVYPLRRGLGTVDVAITTQDGVVSTNTLKAVQAHIDDLRPVTAKDCLIFVPKKKEVAVSVNVQLADSSQLASFSTQINSVLQAYFARLIPGQMLYKSQLEALISDLPGVLDRQISAPSGNLKALENAEVVEWLSLGKVTVGLMP